MKRLRAFLWVGVLVAPLASAGESQDTAYLRELEHWRQERITDLKADWLPLVGLHWLQEGENRVGSERSNQVVLPLGPPRLGSLELRGETVTFRADGSARVTIGGNPVRELRLQPDVSGEPTILEAGTLRLHLIRRGQRFGLRVKDLTSPAVRQLKKLEYFPVGSDYRVTADWAPANGKKLAILNVIGDVEQMPALGEARFRLHGREFRLYPIAGDDGRLFFIFSDLTRRKETYPAGRYLYADPPRDGKVVLDFNKAYSPPCAFTAFATCPLPPKENRLEVRVEAGEKYTKH